MMQTFLKHLKAIVGDPLGGRYLLAVSGGMDSSVLAALFHRAGLPFAIAHCNFHLRGEDSNRDMRFVQEMAERFQVPCFVQEFDTLALQKESGASIEMIARELRYSWFEEIGREYDYIVTAHHADDAAETMLMNLCRGTGLKGMVGIPERNGKIIRPLLRMPRQKIQQYAEKENISFVVDYTNSDTNIKRNKIRHDVLPVLAEINPNLTETLSKNRDIFQIQYQFYEKQIERIKERIIQSNNGKYSISVKQLRSEENSRLILYEILKDFHFNAAIVDELSHAPQTGTTYHSGTHTLIVNRDEYLIQPYHESSDEKLVFHNLEELSAYFRVETVIRDQAFVFPKDNHSFFIPIEKLKYPVSVRHWQPGDYFHPLGCKGRQKVSDFFTDHKIDGFSKKSISMLCIGTDIVWIIGHRSDERYKVTEKDNKFYKISINE